MSVMRSTDATRSAITPPATEPEPHAGARSRRPSGATPPGQSPHASHEQGDPGQPALPVDRAAVDAAAGVVMEAVPLTMRAIRREMRAGRDPSLSVPQFRALLFLRREPNVGLGAAAEHLGITAGAASELIERLVRQGLVDRDADPRERRRIRLRLTERGADQLLAAEKRTRLWISSVLEGLDEKQLDRLAVALSDLRGAIESAPAPVGDAPVADGDTAGS